MTSPTRLIKKAQAIRDREHRLKPSLRLKNEAEMIQFIHGKGLVSVLGGNELPSIINAVLGKSWKPSAKGFKGWLDWWALNIEGRQVRRVIGDIERRNDILATRNRQGHKDIRIQQALAPCRPHSQTSKRATRERGRYSQTSTRSC